MLESDIFEPFERLVEIEILGERREVPENNTLLRCFQYLSMDTISFGDFFGGTATAPIVMFGWKTPRKTNLFCRAAQEFGKE